MGPEPALPLDLRKLRYFVAVAEELHFGRAAQRLYITQPVLSRQIRKLERELGADLLLRTSRDVTLTPAGIEVLEEARSLLAAADRTRRRIEDVVSGEAALTVGFFVGDTFTAALEAFSERYPDVAIALLRVYWHDQTEVLHDGRADVGFVHLPVDDHGLELLPVRSEPRVAVLPTSHPSAHEHEISIADLADDPVIIQRGATAAWQAFHNVDPRPDGRHPPSGPAVDNLEEKLQHVAAGRAISFVPASVAGAHIQPGIAYVPVSDIPPIQICLAWKSGQRTALVSAFAEAVTDARSSAGRPRRGRADRAMRTATTQSRAQGRSAS
jgi:DNA-binding transcriptional LysR family regulator